MRSKIAVILVGGAFLLAGAPMALAKTAHHLFSGEVTHLDSTAKTVAVKGHSSGKADKEMTFTLGPEAKIVDGIKARKFGELEVGTRVQVSYADEGSAHQAMRIEMLPPRTAKAAASTAPSTGSKPKSKSHY